MTWLSELDRLQHLESELALLPVGRGPELKAPQFLGRKYGPEEDWTIQALTVEEIRNHRHQPVHSVGARTGLHTGPLAAFDFDGKSTLKLGLYPRNFTTWQVHRDNDPFRLKVLCRPTPEQISQLPQQADGSVEFQGKTPTAPKQGDGKGEALEVFFAGGRQVVVLGEHPVSGGNYFWPDGLGPEALATPPDDWWAHAVRIAQQCRDRIGTPCRSTTRQRTRKLDPCPICGRHSGRGGSALWCEETTKGLILCMPGSTFSAEQKHGPLRVKDVVDGYALVKRSPIPEGDVLAFKRHQPLPCRRQQNARNQYLARLAVTAS